MIHQHLEYQTKNLTAINIFYVSQDSILCAYKASHADKKQSTFVYIRPTSYNKQHALFYVCCCTSYKTYNFFLMNIALSCMIHVLSNYSQVCVKCATTFIYSTTKITCLITVIAHYPPQYRSIHIHFATRA
jgi:hypothetical protein